MTSAIHHKKEQKISYCIVYRIQDTGYRIRGIPEGTSTDMTGVLVLARAAIMVLKGSLGTPLKENPNMLSTIKSN